VSVRIHRSAPFQPSFEDLECALSRHDGSRTFAQCAHDRLVELEGSLHQLGWVSAIQRLSETSA
jgi:hypothetical protein